MQIIAHSKMTIGQIDPMIYGHFLEHHHRQIYGGVWDPESQFADEDGFRTDVLEAMRAIKIPILRWPGGCFVSAYHWKEGVGKERLPSFDKAWRVEESNAFGTDEFIKLCRKLNCKPYICTNAGTGTAEEMSDWVEYCNLETEGRWARQRIAGGNPAPYNVRYWSVGNENWGAHEMGAKKAAVWGELVRESCKMMLRVDPSIALSAAAIPDPDWNMNLLREAGVYLNWISIHSYWDFSPDGETHFSYSDTILHTGEEISGNIHKVRADLTAWGLEKQIKIAYDEWNLKGWYHPNLIDNPHRVVTKEEYLFPRDKNDNNRLYTMADAIFTACFLNTCIRNCDIVGMACFSPFVNTRGVICTHRDGLVLRPSYYVFYLYANLLKPAALNSWVMDVPQYTGTFRGKSITVDLVDAVVTFANGEYAIAAVNKDPENVQTMVFSALEEKLSVMRLHTLNGPRTDSYNDLGTHEVDMQTSAWLPFDGSISLPPHSVCVIEIRQNPAL